MGYNELLMSSRRATHDDPIHSKDRKGTAIKCSLSAPARTFRIRATYEMGYVVESLPGFVPYAVDLYFRSSVETRHVGR